MLTLTEIFKFNRMDFPTKVAYLRFKYHANMLDVNNTLNQLGIISDDSANRNNKRHFTTLVEDIFPRLGIDTDCLLHADEEP